MVSFSFAGGEEPNCKFSILNAGIASYPEAWPNGSVVFSYDRKNWFRAPTRFEEEILHFEHFSQSDILYVALTPPFSLDRHHDLICRALGSEFCELVGHISTVEHRAVEVLKFGASNPHAPKVWVIARQHPGEPMSEWFMQGLIDALTDPKNSLANQLRNQFCFLLVPNMNPDGTMAGNLRTNAAGVDLNRAWARPSFNASPEVAGLLDMMVTTGVDLFLDIHGDEEFRFVFAAGCEGIPNFSSKMAEADRCFRKAFHEANRDFSVKNGYAPDASGEGDLSIACNQVGFRFGCLSLTIEMPFKDNAETSDPSTGWGIQQSIDLGKSVLHPIASYFEDR